MKRAGPSSVGLGVVLFALLLVAAVLTYTTPWPIGTASPSPAPAVAANPVESAR